MRETIVELSVPQFPPLLQEIADPPKKLFLRGALPDSNRKWLCVVGSRKYSPYGKSACADLIRGLAGYPVVIVSGLALGIDGIAHEAALEAGLPTVAVPGSGLHDRVLYPRSHYGLAQRILKTGGALLSEFEPNWNPRPESFPQRNRIMAGLSHAVFVIEATEKSGTLITSRLATDYNRDVYALPHPIDSAGGAGPHLLMKMGATPIRTSLDILEALQIAVEEKSNVSLSLPDNEKAILDLLSTPTSKDEFFKKVGIPLREAQALLSKLEIKGLVEENFGVFRTKQ